MIILKNDIYSIIYLFIKFNYDLNLNVKYILLNDNSVYLVNDVIKFQLYDQFIQDFLYLIKNLNKCINIHKLTYYELQNMLLGFLNNNINLKIINSISEVSNKSNIKIIDFYTYFSNKYKLHQICNTIYQMNKMIILNNNIEAFWFSRKDFFNYIIKDLTIICLNNTNEPYLNMVKNQDKYINTQNIIIFCSFILIITILIIKIVKKVL